MSEPYVLVIPTYGGEKGERPVLPQIIKFLNVPGNRALLRGVVSCGNRNFGRTFCLAGKVVAQKCEVEHLHQVELFGTPEDVAHVKKLLEQLSARLSA